MMTRLDPGLADAAARAAKPHAVVIGAGLGGLAAAVRLGAAGWRCTVLDRLDRAGGRGSSISQGGHRFDLGPTIVTAPHLLQDLWRLAGRDMAEDVDLIPLDPFYEIRFPDGETFTATGDEDRLRAEVARLSPGDLAGYDRFMAGSKRRYEFGFQDLGRRPLNRLIPFAKTLPTFGLLRADRSVYSYAARHVRDERLRMALSFHPLFIGGDPFRVTSMYALVSHLEKIYGVHYAIGGVQAIADGLAGLIAGQGGTVRQGSEVARIDVEAGRATGVTLASGERIAADITVSNADPGTTYGTLLKGHPKRRWTAERMARSRWSMGLYVWYFGTHGTRSRWPDVGHHTILNGPRYRDLVRDIFVRGHLAEDMSIYLHRPSVTDPTVAPAGGDTFYALAPVPHLGHDRPVDWTAEAPRMRARMLAMLERHLPGLGATITESLVFTPEAFRDRYLAPHGSGFSLEPRILQSAYFRPHNVSEEVENLFLVGAGTHPGAGLPGVISTAEAMMQLVPEVAR